MLILQYKVSLLLTDLVAAVVLFIFMPVLLCFLCCYRFSVNEDFIIIQNARTDPSPIRSSTLALCRAAETSRTPSRQVRRHSADGIKIAGRPRDLPVPVVWPVIRGRTCKWAWPRGAALRSGKFPTSSNRRRHVSRAVGGLVADCSSSHNECSLR